jgi:hypothetical protein
MITSLINKQDNFEIVRNQIAAILAAEFASQMSLAEDDDLGPTPWDVDVFIESTNAFEIMRSDDSDPNAYVKPLVNVIWLSSTFDKGRGDPTKQQIAHGKFAIECYASSQGGDDGSTGHLPADVEAQKNVQQVARLVRNILMSPEYAYLGMRKTVESRWVNSVNSHLPKAENEQVRRVSAITIDFSVAFVEFSPQYEPENLELIHITVSDTGQVLVEAEFDVS